MLTAASVPQLTLVRVLYNQSSALMRSESNDMTHGPVAPSPHALAANLLNTWIEMILAAEATPEKVRPPRVICLPATIPATWVPWLQPLLGHGSPAPVTKLEEAPPGQNDVDCSALFVVEKQAWPTTLPRKNS